MLNADVYNNSIVNWDLINQLALIVVKESKVPGLSKPAVYEEREKSISYGFLGLKTRIEKYKELISPEELVDYWNLENFDFRSKEDLNESYIKVETNERTYDYNLRTNGELFIRCHWQRSLELQESPWY